MPRVFLLKPGSIERDENGTILDARSSSTLIISQGHKIVVDSGQKGEEEAILRALADMHIKPEDVEILINTHGHADHCGNNHLFYRSRIGAAKEGEVIAPGVWVMATPGHSSDSISVVVETDQTVVIAGDALPTFGNFLKKVPPALRVDYDLAVASMCRIIKIADVVIPGHDHPFSLQKEAYVPLPFSMSLKEH
jgi:glyoxylase-like metal-dependent hydrolase (beta-lactamase superfamily II)